MNKGRVESRSDCFSIMLNYQPLGLVRANARDIRPDGMSVDTGRVSLPRNSAVEVSFSFRNEEDRVQVHRLDATVTESGLQGTRLTFRDCSDETRRVLKAMTRRLH